ncbi:MAG TPA: hypothetical protein DEF14_07125 [Ruminococcaceae bacterium]|nr:hypothetical protein [Oscillospiraceae bacterium]HBW72735.1 hypothetical protein [Oscillospiraceae bacterium]
MIVYFAIVIAFCVIYPFVPRKHIKWLFLALVLALSVMAFYVKPLETDDLLRYYNSLDLLRKKSLSGYFDLQRNGYGNFDAVPVCGLYFFFVSKLGNNNFLPAITIFLTYGSMLLVIWRFANYYKISKLYIFVGTFFLLSTYWYYDTCSGIRNGLAFAVAMFCIYFDLVEKKKIFCLGYFVAMGIHSAAVIFLGLRLLTEINMRLRLKILNAISLVGIFFGSYIIEFFGKIFNNSFFEVLLEKTAINKVRVISFTSGVTILSIALLLAVIIMCIYMNYRINMDDVKNVESINYFFILLLFFSVGSLSSYLIFTRFMHWVIPMFGSLIIMLCLDLNRKKRQEIYFAPHGESTIKRDISVYRSNELILNLMIIALSMFNLYFLCFVSVIHSAKFGI